MNRVIVEPPKKGIVFRGSKEYWDERYKKGGTSGPGSYNRLSYYKAEVVNAFITEHRLKSCIEWGCGDGNQLSLMKYSNYLGLDISEKAIEICKDKFSHDSTKEFKTINKELIVSKKYDLSISLDVIYHLIEDDVFKKYIDSLFSSSRAFVCIYSSNVDTEQCGYYNHIRHRKFTDYIENHIPKWRLYRIVENKYPYNEKDTFNTSFCDFYFYKKKNILDYLKKPFLSCGAEFV